MPIVKYINGDLASLSAGKTASAKRTTVDLLAGIPIVTGAPTTRAVIWPAGSIGKIRIRVGGGVAVGVSITLTVSSSPFGALPRSVVIPLPTAGDYYWPAGRLAAPATLLTGFAIPVSPGAAISLDLLRAVAMQGTEADSDALGLITQGPYAPGSLAVITSSGPALVTSMLGWTAGDLLVGAAGGLLRNRASAETGLDQYAVAGADQLAGDTRCPVTVDIKEL